MAENQEQH
jgi:hypothetical protein